jgi:hypothetical protein
MSLQTFTEWRRNTIACEVRNLVIHNNASGIPCQSRGSSCLNKKCSTPEVSPKRDCIGVRASLQQPRSLLGSAAPALDANGNVVRSGLSNPAAVWNLQCVSHCQIMCIVHSERNHQAYLLSSSLFIAWLHDKPFSRQELNTLAVYHDQQSWPRLFESKCCNTSRPATFLKLPYCHIFCKPVL